MTTIIYISVALAIGYWLGRYRSISTSFQNRGEAFVSREIRANFRAPDFHLFNHITLEVDGGTTQIDHILVSRSGVFVIETKNYSGWIFANPRQATWTQTFFRKKFKFQNPIFQNIRHVKAVEALLDFLPPDTVKSAVVFVGDAKFKTEMPKGVYTLSGFINLLRDSPDEVISLNRVQFCVGRLEAARLAISGQTDVKHVKNLERRYGKKS